MDKNQRKVCEQIEGREELTKEKITQKNYNYLLLENVHAHLPPPKAKGSTFMCTGGRVTYFHYGCDKFVDHGWGCAYRTLQSICSWIIDKRGEAGKLHVPSLNEIQRLLVQIGDKPAEFVGSRDWIGAMEVFYVIDALYDVPCKIVHVQRSEDLRKYANVLQKYFEDFGGFVMMGGDVDAASKGIAGVHLCDNQVYFLVVDPHFTGVPRSAKELIDSGYVRWQHTSQFVDSSFYNLCLPQL